jgi:hypothetical protein
MSWISVRKALTVGAVVPAVALTFAVSGCGAGDEVAEKLTEEAVEEAAGGDTDVDIDDDGLTVTDENGDQSSIGTDLPDDFPMADVPLVEGTVISSTAVDGASYMVMLEVEGTPEEVQDEALALLTDAGYTSGTEMNSEGYYASTLSKDGFEVGVTSMEGDSTAQVQYVVTVG